MKPLLVFDFDGTLCDSKKITVDIFQRILVKHKKIEIDEKFIERYFMRNPFTSLRWLLKHKFYLAPRILEAYTLIAKEELLNAEIFPGIKDLLLKLSKTYRMAIVTSNSSIVVKKFLNKHGIRDCFLAIYGMEDGKSKKNKLIYCMQKFHVPAHKIVFFTDTYGDIKEGNAVHVYCVGCSWGFHSKEILEKSKPYRVISDVKEIEVIARQHAIN